MGCDLFLNKPENDLLKEIDAAIDYANTARLSAVTVAVPEGWGINNTPVSTIDIRQGYAFELDFTPYGAFGFVKWRGFRSSVLAENQGWETNPGLLDGKDAAEVAAGEGTRASITINTTDPITLVPWCEGRPRYVSSSPAKNQSGVAVNLPIYIYFNIAMHEDTVGFRDGSLQITYVDAGGNLVDLSPLFNAPELTGNGKAVKLSFKGEAAEPYLPTSATVTVTAGKNIGAAGNAALTMEGAETVIFTTGVTEAASTYRVEDLRAGKKADDPTFYYNTETNWNNADHRLLKEGGYYYVYLYYGWAHMDSSVIEPPNGALVWERWSADLKGDPREYWADTAADYENYDDNDLLSGTVHQGTAYSSATGQTLFFVIRHKVNLTFGGYIDLVVLPYLDANSDNDTDDPGDIAAGDKALAWSQGQYVRMVVDGAGPSSDVEVSFDIGKQNASGVYVFSGDPVMTVNLMENVRDNGVSGGKLTGLPGEPLTMDGPVNLRWRYVITSNDNATEYYNSDWFPVSGENANVETIPLQSDTSDGMVNLRSQRQAGGTLWLYFKDNLGNETEKESSIGVAYVDDVTNAIAAYGATVNTEGTSINVSWTNPTDPPGGFEHIEASYRINGGASVPVTFTDSTTATSFTIAASPITTSDVLSGTAVGNVNEYEITLESHSITDKKWQTFKVWNIPDMSVSHTYPAIEVTTATGDNDDTDGNISLANLALNNANKTYVLTADIALSGAWTPIGTGSGANAFQGKFYGNGHTITVNGNPAPAQYTGIFGYVSGAGAEIRDLTVDYGADTTVTGSGTQRYTGGLAGYVSGGVQIRNIIVKSTAGKALLYTQTAASYTGGIAGYMTGSSDAGSPLLDNAYCGLTLSIGGTAAKYAGGIAGYISNTGSIEDCVWEGLLTTTPAATVDGSIYFGGISGSIYVGSASTSLAPDVSNAAARGNITVKTGSGSVNVGGLVATMYSQALAVKPTVSNSYYETGAILVESAGTTYLGGAFGQMGNTNANGGIITDCFSRAGSITVSKYGTGSFGMGGFGGYVFNAEFIRCYSESPLTLSEAPETTLIWVGGFIGYLYVNQDTMAVAGCYAAAPITARGNQLYVGGLLGSSYVGPSATLNVSNCYATGNVFSFSSSVNYSGGLIGLNRGNLSECWASGRVEAKGIPGKTSLIHAGGLVGQNNTSCSIENCYATGEVIADDPYSGDDIYAGGLAGSNFGDIRYSFSTGNVTAQSNSTRSYAGGLVGYCSGSGNIQYSVAAGETIIAKGPHPSTTAARAITPSA
jgi:hypothetical protein